MKMFCAILFLTITTTFCGSKYIGGSQTDIEGGYSSDEWNLGLGIRGFIYQIDHPSKLSSNGDLEISLFYLQKKVGNMKFQFGQSYSANFIYSRTRNNFGSASEISIVKVGLEAGVTEKIGFYWSCSPVYLSSIDLTQLDSQDRNELQVGPLNPKIGIRYYF